MKAWIHAIFVSTVYVGGDIILAHFEPISTLSIV